MIHPFHLSLADPPPLPSHSRILFTDKGLKNEVKRRHNLQPEEHLAERQGRPACWETFIMSIGDRVDVILRCDHL